MNPYTRTTTTALAYGSVCSGIEAVSLAWEPLGLMPAWFAETDPFASAVLAHRHPRVPNLGDMTQLAHRIRAQAIAAPDILVGGTPCQSFSVAGARQGLADPRGALTLAYVEIANAIDQVRTRSHRPPATLVWENVPGVLSDRGNAFGCLLGALAGEDRALEPPGPRWTNAGCVSGPRRRIAWRVLDAQYFGVAQRRRRVFLVASGGDHIDPAEILFEQEGVHGDPSPSRAPWQSAARTAGAGAPAAGRSSGLISPYGKVSITLGFGNAQGPSDVAGCLMGAPPRWDLATETILVQSVAGAISHTLDTANGGKGSGEDGTGKGVPIIAFTAQGCGGDADAERSPTLRAGAHRTSHANAGVVPAIAFAQNWRSELRWESGDGQIAGTLSIGLGRPGQGRTMVLQTAAHEDHYVCALEGGNTAWGLSWRVRRLMPRECERLQGMPDDHTLVLYRGKLAADAPRYRAIGNSMAVPCVAWLGARLRRSLVGKS
ncbi:DNA cytosine methyltransferase [Xanthomonas campestris pv. zinniae]|nr:DNA cytosine methyltransferase [Xanthomonas campestris pv. zinniae]